VRLKTYQKIFLCLLSIGVVIWIGGSIVQTSIAYDIFEPKINAISFRYWVNDNLALWTVRHFAVGSLYTNFGFLLALISSIVLFPYLKSHFKSEGWIFMSYVLFSIAVLSQLILFYWDTRLGLYVFFNSNLNYYSNEIQNFFHRRFAKFNFLIVYNWLALFTIITFLIFQPLKRHKNEAEGNI
jgi:hypothetical protein